MMYIFYHAVDYWLIINMLVTAVMSLIRTTISRLCIYLVTICRTKPVYSDLLFFNVKLNTSKTKPVFEWIEKLDLYTAIYAMTCA